MKSKLLKCCSIFFVLLMSMSLFSCTDFDIDTSNLEENILEYIEFNDYEVYFDGEEHSIYINEEELPEGYYVEYTGNEQSEVGEYEVTAAVYDEFGEFVAQYTATINIMTALNIIFDDYTVFYDGEEHSIYINEEELPEGYYVEYNNNTHLTPGNHQAMAYIYNESSALVGVYTAYLHIMDIIDVKIDDTCFLYDGNSHSIYADDSELPEGYYIEYTGNEQSEIGDHEVTITLYNEEDSILVEYSATLSIIPASEIVFNGCEVVYTGSDISIYVEDLVLPEGYYIEYIGNEQSEIGEYEVIATLYNSENEILTQCSAIIIIIDISDIVLDDFTFVFDNSDHSVIIDASYLPEGYEFKYIGNDQAAIGEYEVIVSLVNRDDETISEIVVILTILEVYNVVTYNIDGVETTEKVVFGSEINYQEYPSKEGYDFAGWFLDENFTELYDETTAVTKDITLYAAWCDGTAGLKYTINSNCSSYSVSNGTGITGDIVISSYYHGLPVITISSDGFSGFSNITSITIPTTITTIDSYAFLSCDSLTKVYYMGTIEDWLNITFYNDSANPMYSVDNVFIFNSDTDEYELVTNIVIPDTVTEISKYAFYNCTTLESITISQSIESIELYAFYECINLKNIYYLGTIEDWCKIDFSYVYSSPMNYAENFYMLDEKNEEYLITELVIPDTITNIKACAFSGFSQLTSIIINDYVESIGSFAFSGCTNVTTIENLESVESIGQGAFSECYSLESITICFTGNGDDTTHFGYIFGSTSYQYNYISMINSLTTVIIVGLDKISANTFYDCYYLENITLPSSVESIGANAFYNCTSLTNIYYDGSIEDWCNIEFENEYSNPMWYAENLYMLDENGDYYLVTNVVIPDTITEINSYTFAGFDQLISVVISGSIEQIGTYAFYNCSKLTMIEISQNVDSIGYAAFSGCDNLESITIPFVGDGDTNTYFGYIFGAEGILESHYIPSGLTTVTITGGSIGSGAFYKCSNIENIIIYGCVESIEENAFRECYSLVNICYNGNIEDWLNIEFENEYSNPMHYAENFYMLDENGDYYLVEEIIIIDEVTTINNYAFYGFSKVTNVVIPSCVEYIGSYAFYGCDCLESITIPFVGDGDTNTHFGYIFGATAYWETSYIPSSLISVTITGGSIESYAFASCYNITSIILPSNLEYIAEAAFYGCSIENIVIPTSILKLDSRVFYGCSDLKNVYYDGSIEDWINIEFVDEYSNPMWYAENIYMLDEDGEYYLLTEIEIPDSITSINAYTFYGFNNVTSVVIPDSVEYIGYSALGGCDNLESITIPFVGDGDTNTYFGYIFGGSVYYNYSNGIPSSLTSVTIAGGSIGSSVFSNCVSIESIIILEGVESIYASAFNGCSSLTSITIPSSIKYIDSPVFSNLETVYYTGTIEDWMNIEFVNVESNPMYYAENFYMLDKTGDYYLLTEIVIPDSITSINAYAFYGFNKVTSVVITDCVEYIGYAAFSGCDNLESITLPFVGDGDTKTHFGYIFGAEYYTYNSNYVPSSLTSVIITGGSSIGTSAFDGCHNLTSITLPSNLEYVGSEAFSNCTNLQIINLPEELISIGDYAFYRCSSLINILIPISVESIGSSAFINCGNIVDICYMGGIEDWCNIEFGNEYSNPMYYTENFYMLDENGDYYLLTDLIITDKVTNIKAYCFSGCSFLTTVVILGSIEEIGTCAFYNCSKLTKIEISQNVESIGYAAFGGCDNLESLAIPFVGDGDTNTHFGYIFGASEYRYNSQYVPISLKTITIIGESSISAYAFCYCSNIESITSIDATTYIGYYAFYGCESLETIILDEKFKESSQDSFYGCANLQNVYYDGNIEDWCSIDFYNLYSTPMYYAENFYIYNNETNSYEMVTNLDFSDSIDYVKYLTLYGFDCLESITLPFVGDGDTNAYFGYIFGANTYSENSIYVPSSLTSVTITGGSSIESYAFYYCINLQKINLPEGLISIGDYAFCGCSSLTNIVIPEGVESIYASAFYGCSSLTSITIPSSIKYIDSPSYSNLEIVYYNGTIEDWCNIEFANEYSNPMYYAENFYMLDEDGEYYLVTELIIPDSVTNINDYAFYGFSQLTSVVIPSSVEYIGYSAFVGCDNLESITIPFVGDGDTNTYFGYIFGASSYYNYSNDIPSSLTSVTITGGNSIESYAFYNCSSIESIIILEGVESIYASAFYGCSSLTSITIPSSIKYIDSPVFSNLETVYYTGTIEDWMNIEFVNEYSNPMYCAENFYILDEDGEYYLLTELIIPDTIIEINAYTFSGFSQLTSVVIHDSVEYIGTHAFYNCYHLVEIYNLSSLEISAKSFNNGNIGYYALNIYNDSAEQSKLSIDQDGFILYINDSDTILVGYIGCESELIIPKTVTSINDYAFYYCTDITSVTIHEDVEVIGANAFSTCNSLVDVYYNGSLDDWMSIEFTISTSNPMSYASHFYMLDETGEYYEVTEIEIPESITYIGEYTFYGFNNVVSITIHEDVESIGNYAFSACYNLISITIPKSIEYINWGAFLNCYKLVEVYNLSSITIVKGSEDNGYIGYYALNIYTDTYGSSKLSKDEDGFVLYTSDSYVIVVGYEGTNTDIIIPDNVNEINQYAFYGLSQLTSVVIPSNVEYIGYSALGGCDNLESITIPFVGDGDTNTYFGYIFGAEYYTYNSDYVPSSLTSVTIAGGSIGSSVFSNCLSVESIIILEGVESIYASAFNGCSSLTSITIPSSIKYIDSPSYSNLEIVYYNGTIEDWMNIEFANEYSNPMYYAENIYMLDEDGEYYLLTEIEIPDSITSINAYTFYGFNNVTSVVIPDSVEYIGYSALGGCDNLESITIPFVGDGDTNTYFGYIFGGSVYYNYSNGIPSSLTSVTIAGGSIGSSVFSNCVSIESIIILEGVESIYASAFNGCSSLTSITIPSSIKYIDSPVFSNLETVYYTGTIEDWMNIEFVNEYSNPMYCAENFYMLSEDGEYYLLTEIEIPDTVTTINDYAFYGFSQLVSVVIHDSVEYIGYSALGGCDNLESITIPFVGDGDTNTHFGYIFGATSYWQTSYIPNSLTSVIVTGGSSIESYSFYFYTNIESITIYGYANICEYAFYKCSNLETLIFAGQCNIAPYAVYNCDNLLEVEIAYSDGLSNYAFSGCNNLLKVEIKDGISIEESVFISCSSITEIIIPSSIKYIDSPGYYNLENVYYNGTIEDWCNIEFANEYSNPMCYAENIYMLDENGDYYLVTEIIIPESITNIGAYTFYGFNNVTSVTIHDSVEYIGEFTFRDCYDLISITISKIVEYIGFNAFYNCENLETVYYNGTIEEWCNIEFANEYSNPMCYAENIYMLDEKGDYYLVIEIIIPESITNIGAYTFYGFNNVTSVTIHDSVEVIGTSAFSNCYNLTSLIIPASVEYIGFAAFGGCENLESITIPFVGDGDSNTYFGYIFGAVTYGESNYVPSSLTSVIITGGNSIESYAFYNCSSIENIIISEGLENIYSNVFVGCTSLSLTIPNSVKYIGFYNLETVYYNGTLEEWNNIDFDDEYGFYYLVVNLIV